MSAHRIHWSSWVVAVLILQVMGCAMVYAATRNALATTIMFIIMPVVVYLRRKKEFPENY